MIAWQKALNFSSKMHEPAVKIAKPKIFYIDRLKVILTVLVIIHHAAISYGAPGGWYYSQKTGLPGVTIAMTALVAVNQSFFMGFFFFLSALFIPSSYDKKGPKKFVLDRLTRLGIPLLFYSFILSPLLSYMPYNYTGTHPAITYVQYLSGFDSWISFGVLWFVAALLLFTLLYVLGRLLVKQVPLKMQFPGIGGILLFAVILGVITYFVRIIFPVGWVLQPLGFQLGHFPQYISLFILGLIAARNNWLDQLTPQPGKQMRTIALCLIFIGFPLFFFVQRWLNFPVSQFNVGGHWPSLWYAIWEQITGLSIITALLCIGKSIWNQGGAALLAASRATFAMYIFHPLVLIAFTVAIHHWNLEPGVKFLVAAPVAVVGTFLLAQVVIRIPGVNKVI